MKPVELLNVLGTIGETQDGIAQLRDMVRQLAIQGGLSVQSGDDEPAHQLLSQIAGEKRRLVKTGAIRAPRPLPKEDPASYFDDLPAGWAANWLANCVPFDLTDGDWVESKDQDPNGSIRLTQLADIGVGTFKDVSDRFLNEATALRLGCTSLLPNDVLIARLPRPLGRACLFPGSTQTCVTVVDVAIARPGSISVLPSYLTLTLNAPETRDRIALLATGTTRQRVSTGNLRQLPVRVPPLAEQRRIVAKVDELMGLLDELERARDEREARRAAFRDSALAALQNAEDAQAAHAAWTRIASNLADCLTDPADIAPLRQTILQLAVRGRLVPQDPRDEPASKILARSAKGRQTKTPPTVPEPHASPLGALPSGWVSCRMYECFDITGGIQKSGKRRPQHNSYPYLRVANVQRGSLSLDEVSEFELFEGELQKYRLRAGDLLVVEGNGSESEVGRCARWSDEIPECVHQNHLIRCRPLEQDVEFYTLIFLNSPVGMSIMKGLAVTTSGLYNLSVGKIKSIEIALPPIAEQRRIVAKVDELMVICDELEQHLTEAKAHQSAFAAAAVHHLEV